MAMLGLEGGDVGLGGFYDVPGEDSAAKAVAGDSVQVHAISLETLFLHRICHVVRKTLLFIDLLSILFYNLPLVGADLFP